MIDEAQALELAQRAVGAALAATRNVVRESGASAGSNHEVQTEAIVVAQRSGLTRFADFAIHQNVVEDGAWLSLRVVIGKRTGAATTNSLDPGCFGEVAWRAARFALASPADPAFVSLPSPDDAQAPRSARPAIFHEPTARAGPEERAAFVKALFDTARASGVSPAGSVTTEDATVAVANSLGVAQAVRASEAESSLVCTATGGETGWTECVTRKFEACDPEALAARAAEKALAARRPVAVDPAPWTVVLEPAAVAELVGLLSYCGFGALAEQEGQSFMSGRLGEPITGSEITIVDDATDPRTMSLPFDFEGVWRKRVDLIRAGVAAGVVYDTYTGGRAEKPSTGHALPAPNTHGPLATSLVMEGGDSDLASLIASTSRGLLVTRFFYTNPLDPKRTLVTGMTRDGLYMIEDGEVKHAVRNMRMTESILDAFSRVSGLGSELETHRCIVGTAVAPAARIEGFAFSSGTDF